MSEITASADTSTFRERLLTNPRSVHLGISSLVEESNSEEFTVALTGHRVLGQVHSLMFTPMNLRLNNMTPRKSRCDRRTISLLSQINGSAGVLVDFWKHNGRSSHQSFRGMRSMLELPRTRWIHDNKLKPGTTAKCSSSWTQLATTYHHPTRTVTTPTDPVRYQ